MTLTKNQLKQLNYNTTYENNNNEVVASAQQTFFDAMIDAMYPTPGQEEGSGIPSWTMLIDVDQGTYWFYDGRIYFAKLPSGPNIDGSIEPGTNEDYWIEVNASALAHAQNSDLMLGRYTSFLSAISATHNLSSFDGKNDFVFTLQDEDITVDFISTNLKRLFFIRNTGDDQTTGIIRLPNTQNQYVGSNTLVLDHYNDFACFAENFHGTGVSVLLFSSKTNKEGMSDNPFNQDLNTYDSPQFNSLKITARAGTGTRAATYDLDGNLTEKELKSLPDTVLQYLTFYDPVLDENQKWGPVNGVWTLIETL